MATALTARARNWFRTQRVQPQPIAFHSETRHTGLLSAQPTADALLRESLGWSAIATKAIADRIASLEWCVKRRLSDGEEENVGPEHPLVRVLRAGSPLHGPMLMRRLLAQYLTTIGEAYLLKVRGHLLPVPVELWVMHAARVTPELSRGQIAGYWVRTGQGPEILLPAEDVIRIWWPDPENLYGAEGLLGPQAITQDTVKFADQTVREHFEHNAMPLAVVEGSETASMLGTDQIDRLNEYWRQRFSRRQGVASGLPAWLPAGFKLKELTALGGITEIVPMLDHWRDQVLAAYGVPRSILGDVIDVNRAAAETNQFVFDTHTIKPIVDVIAEALTLQLAVPDFGPEFCIRFEDYIPADKDFELRRVESELKSKLRSINGVLERNGEDAVSWGDLPVGTIGEAPYTGQEPDPTLPLDQASALGDQTPPTPPRARAVSRIDLATEWKRFLARERTWTPVFERGMRAVFAMQERQVKAAVRQSLDLRSRADVLTHDVLPAIQRALAPIAWKRVFDQKVEKVRTSAYIASANEALALVGSTQPFAFTQTVADQLRHDADEFRTIVSNTTIKRVSRQVSEELAQGVELGEALSTRTARILAAVGRGFETRKNEARTIARTETLKATQAAQIDGFEQSGVVERKQWNTSQDDAVRDSHQIDGQTVSLDESFELPASAQSMAELADAPGVGANGGRLSAGNTINCRCFVTPVLEGT